MFLSASNNRSLSGLLYIRFRQILLYYEWLESYDDIYFNLYNSYLNQWIIFSGPNFCKGKASGSYAHTSLCTKYFACSNGLTYVMDCAPGTYYNAKKNYCDFPYNVDCPARKSNNLLYFFYCFFLECLRKIAKGGSWYSCCCMLRYLLP